MEIKIIAKGKRMVLLLSIVGSRKIHLEDSALLSRMKGAKESAFVNK